MFLKTKSSKSSGFTLIEILFVIAILSVMASLGLAFLQKRAAQAKVDRAAIEIQQIQEAGLAYYNDNQKWPTADDADQFNPYIPAGVLTTPWGGNFTYAPMTTTGDTSKFRVSTPKISCATAKKLQNLLPSGQTFAVSGKCYVVSDVISGEGMGGKTSLVKIGTVMFLAPGAVCPDDSAGDYCTNFDDSGQAVVHDIPVSCPGGFRAELAVAPYILDRIELGATPTVNMEAKATCHNIEGDDDSNRLCNISATFQGRPYAKKPMVNLGNKLIANYFMYCVKK